MIKGYKSKHYQNFRGGDFMIEVQKWEAIDHIVGKIALRIGITWVVMCSTVALLIMVYK